MMEGKDAGNGPDSYLVLDGAALERVLLGMARRLHASERGDLALVGIRRRGVPLAHRLAARFLELGREVPLGAVAFKRYADDLSLLHAEPRMGDVDLPFTVEGARVVLVDDVLFTGRTLLAASTHMAKLGARSVGAAVVCDRGRPELPVRATVAGLDLEVPDDTIIEVQVPPYDAESGVWLRRRPT